MIDKMNNYKIYNEDCITGASRHIGDRCVDLIICDPPFGINETTFDNHYNRNEDNVISGYIEAPEDYYTFSVQWIAEAKRILKDEGSMYIISGWTKLNDILNAIDYNGLYVVNHIIWKFNFGVATNKKFVSSHYHILYITKDKKVRPTFNTYCRFGPDDRDVDNKSLHYMDLEDVWCINKEYQRGKIKNKNKLPEELIRKIILYSSNPGNKVCDFFLGNFTTATIAVRYGREPMGFELNKEAFSYNLDKLCKMRFGSDLWLVNNSPVNIPENKGKKITDEEKENIKKDFEELSYLNTKKEIIHRLCEKYKRGKFSIENIIKN